MKEKKFYTVKQWKRFQKNDYFDIQDMLCQKYDVILTDYKTKREKVFSILKKINLKNFDKGVAEFSNLIQSFGNSMEQLTKEIDSQKHKDKDNLDLVWGKSDNFTPIWGNSENESQTKHQINLEKIWGKRN